jgi:hypothetical protein
LGAGIISVGILVLIFLVKFVFSKNKTNLDGYTEITRTDQPQLFALIDEIVMQVGTSFPKKYISPPMSMLRYFMTQTF